MKLENAVSASNSLTASSAPALSDTPVSDEEYARRLYAELNGSLFKTRRSAKLVVTEVPAPAATKATSVAAQDEAPSARTVPTVKATAEASVQQSDKQPVKKVIEQEASTQEPTKPAAPVRKLTGIQKELQRLLGDPVPIRSSSKQKSSASSSPPPSSKADETDNSQCVATSTKQHTCIEADHYSRTQPQPERGVRPQPQADRIDRPKRKQDGDTNPMRSASPSAAQPAPTTPDATDSSPAPVAKAANVPAPPVTAPTTKVTKHSQPASRSEPPARVKPASPRQATAAKAAEPAAAPAVVQQEAPPAASRRAGERAGRSMDEPAPAVRTRRTSSSSGRQQEPTSRSTTANQDPAQHGAAVKPEPVSEPPPPTLQPQRASQRAAAKVARSSEDGVAPRTRASSPSMRVAVLAEPKEEKAPAPTPVVQPPKALFKRQADHSSGGSTAPRKQPRVAAGGTAFSRPFASQTPAPPPTRASPPQPHPPPTQVKHELASITQDTPMEAPHATTTAPTDPTDPQSRPPSSRLASRRNAAAATVPSKASSTPTVPNPHSEPTPSHVHSSAAPSSAGPTRPPKALAKAVVKARRIPKMPMVRYGKKWYRAKVVKQQGTRVMLEFPGLAFVPIELDCESDRIWTGSYKGKDWRHLGDGAWEPKKHAFRGMHSKSSASSTPTSTANTGKQSHSSAPDAGTDNEPGEQTSKQQVAPEEPVAQPMGEAPEARPECLSAKQDGAANASPAAAAEAGEVGLLGHIMRKMRTSRSPHHTKGAAPGAALLHDKQQEHEEKHAAAGGVSTPSCSSQEHAATWHEPVADDCHSEDGAVTMAAPRQPALPPIHTSCTHAALPHTASCSAEAGTTPHTASVSVSASTQQDALLSFVGSCANDAAAAAGPARDKALRGAKGCGEQQGAWCVESVVTSCGELQASAADGTTTGGADGSPLPASPKEVVVPHRCRRKGKPMRARIDCEEDLLPPAHDSTSVPSTSANKDPQFATSKQPLLAPAPILSATNDHPTPSCSANEAPPQPSAADKPCPLEVCPKQPLFSCTLSNSVATNQASSAEPSPQPFHQQSLASSTSYPGSTHSSPTTLPNSSDPLDGEREGAALLASLRHQKLTLCPTVEAAAAAAAAKRRRRGNGWTKIMRPSRPTHHHTTPAPMWEESGAAATLSSIQGSTMTATNGPEPMSHSPRGAQHNSAKRVHPDMPAAGAARSPRRAAVDISSRAHEAAAPTTSHTSAALQGTSPRDAGTVVGSKRLWDAIDQDMLVAAVAGCSTTGWPGISALAFGHHSVGPVSAPVHAADPSGWGEGPIGGGSLPGSILSYLRQVQPIPGVMSMPALCRHDPMPFPMGTFPLKPPVPLFKPLSD